MPNLAVALNHCVLQDSSAQHSSAEKGSAVCKARLGRNSKPLFFSEQQLFLYKPSSLLSYNAAQTFVQVDLMMSEEIWHVNVVVTTTAPSKPTSVAL